MVVGFTVVVPTFTTISHVVNVLVLIHHASVTFNKIVTVFPLFAFAGLPFPFNATTGFVVST